MIVILSGLLIFLIIPLSAVYELWSGAVRERQCHKLREQLKEQMKQNRAAEETGASRGRILGDDYDPVSWADLDVMAVDDLNELQGLIEATSRRTELLSNGNISMAITNPMRNTQMAVALEDHSNESGTREGAPGWDTFLDEKSGYTYFHTETLETRYGVEETWNCCDRVPKEPGLKLSDLESRRVLQDGTHSSMKWLHILSQ